MAICIKCGGEAPDCLCEACRPETDMEKLCMDVAAYRPGSGENPLWDRICKGMRNPNHFKNLVFALSEGLPSPRKEYVCVMGLTGASANVLKESRPWFYGTYRSALECDGLTEREQNRLHGIALGALYMDYRYHEAGTVADKLSASEELPWQACFNLVKFYLVTRQYDMAESVIQDAEQRFAGNSFVMGTMERMAGDLIRLRKPNGTGKREYVPNPSENREEIREKYYAYLASIGIEVKPLELSGSSGKSGRGKPEPIPKNQYPDPIETRDADFDTFVAFDLETTGLDPVRDSILEIGAIKVVGGELIETAEYIFQELAKPYDRRLSEEVQKLTGITREDVKDARQMWEVFADFMEFAGDSVLVGFNCVAFDSKFLKRAGRYSHIIMENKLFDVMRYASQFQEQLGFDSKKMSLDTAAKELGVVNPRAHRALSDAVTTAKVFLKLREIDKGTQDAALDELLSDLDSW